jgi:hypothetical protein
MGQANKQEPGTHRQSFAKELRARHRASKSPMSLKAWLRTIKDAETVAMVGAWLHNKRVNTKKALHGIGRTNRLNTKGGK